ncbi:hypothetical protein ABZ479_39855 [Streptomyces sp. NPDC005722]
MRTHIIGGVLLAAALTLTACGNGDDVGAGPTPGASRIDTVDPAEDITFGTTYTWADGLKVTVTEARIFTDFTDEEGPADPRSHQFRAKLRFTNGGDTPADLGEVSTLVMSANEEAAIATSGTFRNGAAPLAGSLAPGATATKTDDAVIDRKHGRKILVVVQRAGSIAAPEFIGSIRG